MRAVGGTALLLVVLGLGACTEPAPTTRAAGTANADPIASVTLAKASPEESSAGGRSSKATGRPERPEPPKNGKSPSDDRRPCGAEGRADGGEWPSLNGDLANSRHQPAEDEIGPEDVAGLVPAWSFAGDSLSGTGDSDDPAPGGMRSTPVVADGCVYLGLGQGYLGDRGDVVALDADTGELVWHVKLDGSVLGLAVADGLVYATPSKGTRGEVSAPVVTDMYAPAGSYAVALDGGTGEIRWTSERLDDGNAANGTFINASPAVFEAGGRDMVFVPLSGGAGDGARVPMYFLDAKTGTTIKKAYSLTDAAYAEGYGGTGIWTTAAYDPKTQHLYAGTADSDGRKLQHEYNNAILKIDANPKRATFSTVVDHYRGISEHADLDEFIGSSKNPACGASAAGSELALPTFFDTSAAPECLELDFDFGSSPNLYRGKDGGLRVGALQKAGVYHAVRAASMERDWRFLVGPGGAANNSATASVADGRVFVGATPNLVFGLDQSTGSRQWVSNTGSDLFAYQPVSSANGVLYTINDSGLLVSLRADDGLPVAATSIATDGGFPQCLGVGAGVAIARHTLFVPCDAGGPVDLAGLPSTPGGLVAYRLP